FQRLPVCRQKPNVLFVRSAFSAWHTTLRRIAAGPMLVVYRKGWPQSASYALSGIILQIINWAFCPATVTGHSSGGNTVLPQAFPYLPCDCTSMGAGAITGKASGLLPFISTGAAGFVLF